MKLGLGGLGRLGALGGVVQCILHEYRKLVFPKPDGGIVTVVYPVVFTPP
jgi:energy-converting hydrogenase Eha subunit A